MIGTAAAEVSLAATRGRSWMSDLRGGRHPEWIAYAVAAVGWAVLVGVEIIRLQTTGSPEVMTDMHAGHDMSGGMPGMTESGPHTHGATSHIVGLLAMLAVMTPMVAADARYAALRAPSGYRRRVPGWVLSGWATGWIPVLVVTALMSLALGKLVKTTEFGDAQLLVVVTAVAIAWQWSSRKRLSLARCHRTLAPPLPRAQARTTCLRYGLGLGNECGISCAPMMMVMMLAGHSVFVVAPLTAVAWYERRRRPHHDPGTMVTSLMLAVVGAVAVLLAVVSAS